MSRPPYSMYLCARSARGPPYPIYLYAGSASRPPYPIYLYARYASRPPCPIYLCAGSAGRPPYPIYLYVGLLAIVIPEIGVPWLRCKDEDKSNVLINSPALTRNTKERASVCQSDQVGLRPPRVTSHPILTRTIFSSACLLFRTVVPNIIVPYCFVSQIGSPHFEKYTVRFTVCAKICTQHCGRLHRIINDHFIVPLPQSL